MTQKKIPEQSLVQGYMRTVIIVFAVFVIVNIAIIVWVFVGRGSKTTNPLWNYVSAHVQQAIVLESDTLLKLLGADPSTISNNPLYTTLRQSNYMGILQFGEGLINQHSAILVDARNNFRPHEFLASINMQDDTDYTFYRYDDNIYVFAQPNTIDMMTDPSHRSITTSDRFVQIEPLIAGKHVALVSRVNPDVDLDPVISDFVAQTDVFVLGVQAQRSSIAIDAHLLYTQPREDILAHDFSANMTEYIDEQTIAYIETSLAHIRSDDDYGSLVAAMREYDPVVFAEFDDQDITTILSQNIAILLQNDESFSDLRLALLFDNPEIHTLIASFFPLLQEPLANIVGVDPASMPLVQEGNRLWYQAALLDMIPLTLQSYADQDHTIVSLGTPTMLEKSNFHRTRNVANQSIGYIFVQFDPLLQLYRQISMMMGQNIQDPFYIQQEQLLQGKTWAGYISVDPDKVSVWSTIR